MGTYSPLIEERVGMPTINWGLHADLGLAALWLKRFESLLRPGDVVVLSIEYGALRNRGRPVGITLAELIDVDPSLLANLSVQEAKAVLDDGLSFFRVLLLRTIYSALRLNRDAAEGVYRADARNRWGDTVGHWGKKPTFRARPGDKLLAEGGRPQEAINRLNAYAERWSGMGVKTLFFYPAVPEPLLANSRSQIAGLHARMENELRMPLLNSPFEMGYPEGLFYDTGYHLTREGTMRRSALLANRLGAWLETHDGHWQAAGADAEHLGE